MKLLLHICCAPCAVAITEKFQKDTDIELEGFYYNPNIHPLEEFNKRKKSVEDMSRIYNMPVT
jgi:predicted adenine nucleotide alpha hydrolase (AANH) superfamily ATPase